ncbi:MAG: 50S ribosomal protein L15 [Pseudomonadales bacterium]|nr:50S ribosomal protein L15 [Pseudomonadales bacterium]
MHLNNLSPAEGSRRRKRRVGRGPGSGWGKTCARGQKGQKSRKSGNVRPGFEGGQQPLKQRVPKFGFRSRVGLSTAEVRLSEIDALGADLVDLDALKTGNVVSRNMKRARVILSGDIHRAVTVKGVAVTRGARAAIEAAGGKVED